MRLELFSRAAACAALALAFSASAQEAPAKAAPPPAAGPYVTVNGKAVPKQRAEVLKRERMAQGAPDNEQLQAMVKEDVISREVVAQEAARTGIDKRPEVLAEIDLMRQTVIVQNFLRDWMRRNPVTEADVQKEYERAKTQTGDKEYHARHILLETEEQAKGVLAELKAGGKFEELAQKNSKDPGNKDRGGDLDWNVPGAFDKMFSDAMVKLDKGQTTEAPVRTRFGYHIIRLEDVRAVKFPQLAEVKDRIQQQLTQRKIEALVAGLRAKATIK